MNENKKDRQRQRRVREQMKSENEFWKWIKQSECISDNKYENEWKLTRKEVDIEIECDVVTNILESKEFKTHKWI